MAVLWRHSLPVLLDLYGPLPLEVVGLVVVGEEGVDGVGAPLHEPRGRVLHRGQGRVQLRLGGVGAHHVGHLVHRDTGSENMMKLLLY